MTVSVRQSAVECLLTEILDSASKLDLVMAMRDHRARALAATTLVLAAKLRVPVLQVAEDLGALARAGILATVTGDDDGWTLDEESDWHPTITSLAKRYADDRSGILRLMSRMSLERLRADAAAPATCVVLTPKLR